MNILHYHKEMRLETGGVVRCVLDLCAGCAAAGHNVTLITADGADLEESWLNHEPGCPRAVVLDPPPKRVAGWLSAAHLKTIEPCIRDADVLHLHAMWGPYNIQLARIARRVRTPYINSVHGMLDDWCMSQRMPKKRLFLALGGRRMLRGAHAVHCTAAAELEQAKKWFPGGRGVVVPLVLDLDPFHNLPGPEPACARFPELAAARQADRPVLLFLSRLHYKKGVEVLLDAAAILRDRGVAPLIFIAGSGDDDYLAMLRRKTVDLSLEEIVRFPGFVSGLEKISLYQAADVFVLPTSQENFGFVVFETLAAATPLVTTYGVDTWPELKASGGALIAHQNPAEIADAVQTILTQPDRGRSMGQAGRQWVLSNLGPEQVIGRFEALYQDALTSAQAS